MYLPLLEDESSEGFAVVVVVVTPVKEIVLVKRYFLSGLYKFKSVMFMANILQHYRK